MTGYPLCLQTANQSSHGERILGETIGTTEFGFWSWVLKCHCSAGVLNAINSSWQNLPPNWRGSDPCRSRWEGVNCTLDLAGIGVTTNDIGDIPSLSMLIYLDLSNNRGIKAVLPQSIQKLQNLTSLILVGCSFRGPVPDSVCPLKKLVYFHLANNRLSGPIRSRLFSSNMSLIHVIVNNNQLNGTIPPTIGLVQTLETIRLDSNSLAGTVPQNITNQKSVSELHLSNNFLTGPLPNFVGMNSLTYVIYKKEKLGD